MVGAGEVAHCVDCSSSSGGCGTVVAGEMRGAWDAESVVALLCFEMNVMLTMVMMVTGGDECGCL